MAGWLTRYYRWLHGQWPAGHVEKLPVIADDGTTNVPGVYVVGDLRGVPLLKFSLDSGAKAVRAIAEDATFQKAIAEARGEESEAADIAIIGAGVAGMAAAVEARKRGLSTVVLEGSEPFSTIVNFPKGKPIYTYPKEMTPAGTLSVSADLKEPLVAELKEQTKDIAVTGAFAERIVRKGKILEVEVRGGRPVIARRVIVAIGRSGNFRKLNVPGEDRDHVYNRLHDPMDFSGKSCLVVGGGDSALETAIALTNAGANVTISYRRKEFSRPKLDNIDMLRALASDPGAKASVTNPVSERVTTASGDFEIRPSKRGSLRLMLGTEVRRIGASDVRISDEHGEESIANDAVFAMIGREPPLAFFRRSGIRIRGEWTRGRWIGFVLFLLFAAALYNWKSGGWLSDLFYGRGWFPTDLTNVFAATAARPDTLFGTIVISASSPSFWYTLAYSLLVFVFGLRRIRRRKTPYITIQTTALMAIQIVPLFLLPEIVLPWLGHNGWLNAAVADGLFPPAAYGHGREYWRSYGFILAWPLMVYNVFTDQPLAWWLWISFFQTFVAIPAIIYFWGKGAYCGWICSCGALAETLGDGHRDKMPHGPGWNKLNMAGQGILAIALVLLALRVLAWVLPAGNALHGFFGRFAIGGYKWGVDVLLAGIIGYGFYFWYSGRVWCRFFCPLAALMHVYAMFSRFAIIPDKKKCISCNVCTSVCHQGIDVMNFANKGLPMKDPECVRCSACVHACPTGVLAFGQTDKSGEPVKFDALPASPVRMKEETPRR